MPKGFVAVMTFAPSSVKWGKEIGDSDSAAF
jgi:hypothetical protein